MRFRFCTWRTFFILANIPQCEKCYMVLILIFTEYFEDTFKLYIKFDSTDSFYKVFYLLRTGRKCLDTNIVLWIIQIERRLSLFSILSILELLYFFLIIIDFFCYRLLISCYRHFITVYILIFDFKMYVIMYDYCYIWRLHQSHHEKCSFEPYASLISIWEFTDLLRFSVPNLDI